MTTASIPSPTHTAPRYHNAAEWLHALGDIPLERIIFDPLPGTATESDLLRLVESGDCLCELVDGTLVEKPMGMVEGYITAQLITRLNQYVIDHKLGGIFGPDSTMRLPSTGRIRLPDLSFFTTERLPFALKRVPTISPDLAVEVLSVSNTPAEMSQKLHEYFDSGTRLAWIVDPVKRTAAVYHRPDEPTCIVSSDGKLDGEDVVPGFTMLIADLLRNLPA